MLSLFPQILFLAPAGTMLIRIAAGVAFLWLAYYHVKHADALSRAHFPILGRNSWFVWVAVIFEAVVGALLMAGIYTQLAALVGAIMALKGVVWKKRLPDFFPLDRTASALLLVICLALLVSGAGAFAFDLPL